MITYDLLSPAGGAGGTGGFPQAAGFVNTDNAFLAGFEVYGEADVQLLSPRSATSKVAISAATNPPELLEVARVAVACSIEVMNRCQGLPDWSLVSVCDSMILRRRRTGDWNFRLASLMTRIEWPHHWKRSKPRVSQRITFAFSNAADNGCSRLAWRISLTSTTVNTWTTAAGVEFSDRESTSIPAWN
jgi:hypothetical protein